MKKIRYSFPFMAVCLHFPLLPKSMYYMDVFENENPGKKKMLEKVSMSNMFEIIGGRYVEGKLPLCDDPMDMFNSFFHNYSPIRVKFKDINVIVFLRWSYTMLLIEITPFVSDLGANKIFFTRKNLEDFFSLQGKLEFISELFVPAWKKIYPSENGNWEVGTFHIFRVIDYGNNDFWKKLEKIALASEKSIRKSVIPFNKWIEGKNGHYVADFYSWVFRNRMNNLNEIKKFHKDFMKLENAAKSCDFTTRGNFISFWKRLAYSDIAKQRNIDNLCGITWGKETENIMLSPARQLFHAKFNFTIPLL